MNFDVLDVLGMDRTQYGRKDVNAAYRPYKLAIRQKFAKPGYSLLADLESVKEVTSEKCDQQSPQRNWSTSPNSDSIQHQYSVLSPGTSFSQQRHPGPPSSNCSNYPSSNKTTPSPSFYTDQTAVDSRRSHSRASPSSSERRSYSRASPPPSEDRSPTHLHATSQRLHNSMLELDELLRDLDEARYATVDKPPNSQSKETTPAPPIDNSVGHVSFADQSKTVAVVDGGGERSDSGQLDIDNMPGHSYETRTVTVTESVPHGAKCVSSATSELDDLMASLSDFKIQATSRQHTVIEEQQESPYARPHKPPPMSADQLDSMLGSLQRDMQNQGAAAAQKGVCAACDQPIAGQAVTAIGKKWHLEHFTCTQCGVELYNRSFFERDERPYCEEDYHKLFSPRCAYCNGPILDKCVTALEQSWHPEHFFCAHCGSPFGDDGFHEKNGKAYCRNDYYNLFAAKCSGCRKPVMQNYITALDGHWHSECFVCKDCRQPFERGSFFEHDGEPYCETHFHAKRGSLCAGCNKPVTGRCVTALSRKYHPEHFVCAYCTKQISKSIFKERDNKPYCHTCFEKLFG